MNADPFLVKIILQASLMARGSCIACTCKLSSSLIFLLFTLLPWKNMSLMKLQGRKCNPTYSLPCENTKRLLHLKVQKSSALYERIWGAPNKANSLEQAFVTKTHHAGPQASGPDSVAIKVASLQNAGCPPALPYELFCFHIRDGMEQCRFICQAEEDQ